MKFNHLIKIAENIDVAVKMGKPFSLSWKDGYLEVANHEAFSLKRDWKSLLLFENALTECIRRIDWRMADEKKKGEAKHLISLLEALFAFFEQIHKKEEFEVEHKESLLMSLYLGGRIPSLLLEKDERAFAFIQQNDLQEKFFDFGLTLKMKEGEVAIPFEIHPFEYAEFSFSDFLQKKRTKKIAYEWKGRVVFETTKGGVLTKDYSLTEWGIAYHG